MILQLFVTDLRNRILEAKEFELKSMVKRDPYQVNAISRMVR